MWQSVSAFLSCLFGPRVEFQDLPLEILSKIASYLNFVDVISYQQTSRRLRDATESRSVWAALAAGYCARHLNYPRPPPESFETKELRQWAMERCIIDEIWKQPTPRLRLVNLTRRGTPFAATIIPGGRWALMGNSRGFIDAYDLRSENPQLLPLISPQKNVAGTGQSIQAIVTSIDSESPTLRFTVAFTGQSINHVAWLHIWQVQLNPGDTLLAHRLLSIPCSRYWPTISLLDDLVARTFTPESVFESWAEVFRWKECSETCIVKSTIRMACQPEFVQVIGNDRLFCADHSKGLYIYNVPDPDTVQYEQTPNPLYYQNAPTSDPIWFYSLTEECHWGYSRLYFDGHHYRLVISTYSGIIGLVIPASREELPYVLKLADLPFKAVPVYGLGLYKGYAGLEGGGVRFGYSWGKGPLEAPVYYNGREGRLIPIDRWSYVAFDEETGRFIGISLKQATLVDFTLDKTRNIHHAANHSRQLNI